MPSSVIAHIDYDPEKQVLKIRFLSGAVYVYYDVPDEVYVRMSKAKSKGHFLNTKIKGNYAFEKIGEAG
ncbi:MAG TPA: KTSC domain-containing protein [Chitinophagaceae bacterium]|nr:KTSC domain-containing protein [Chitinophagaceae bacterium]